jgi:basic amino acid/polyamine antiporter, APA family
MKEIGLKRVLGLPAITFIAVGFMIGGGVFVLTGIVLKISGKALPLAYGLAGIPVFISMLPLAMLGAALPSTGANYKYPSRMVSPHLAFTAVWVYAFASFFGQIPLYALGCANYAGFYFKGISPEMTATAIITFFFIINMLGIRLAALVQGILVIILVSALILFSYRGISLMAAGTVSSILDATDGTILLSTALLSFTYFGANGIIELGGEIKNPGKVIPRAFAIAFAVVGAIYIAVAVATVGSVPLEKILGQEEPLMAVSEFILSRIETAYFVFFGAILALITTLNALFIVGTKSLLMMVEDGLLPKKLGVLSQRFGTPYPLLTVIWICSIIGIYSRLDLQTLASYAALGGLLIFFPIQIASLRLPRLYPERYEKSPFKLKGFFFWFCPIVGMGIVLFFSLLLLVDLKTPQKIIPFILFILSGLVFYLLRSRYLSGQGIHLKDLLHKEDFNE